MVKRSMLRFLAVAGLVVGVSVVRPAPARADWPCPMICAAKTAASGYVGEEAVWYYAGCVFGCWAALV